MLLFLFVLPRSPLYFPHRTQGNFSTATGSMTLIMMILGRVIFQKFGWTTAALITPTVLALTGAGFFSLILFEGTFAPLLSFFGTTPLMAAVIVGAVQVNHFCDHVCYHDTLCGYFRILIVGAFRSHADSMSDAIKRSSHGIRYHERMKMRLRVLVLSCAAWMAREH